ncbi:MULTISPECIES: hypothetical protein [Spirulina sp. CCY15215]|uniref:hypothetical protein n=1 Tax=Spirulina sp. CCY15215 TaxID=2767591 RepID=UPI0019502461|nr:hypothetical protein [Spirulina major]
MSDSQPKAGEPVPQPYPYQEAPTWPQQIGTPLASAHPPHACMGLNSCKGQDRFGAAGPTDGPEDKIGKPNECAGQGYCSTTTDHKCHVQNDCRNQGGCGLNGTAEEFEQPGINDCKSLGSCATPINSERFIVNGRYQGQSVWLRARQVFHEKVWPQLREENPDLPEELPPIGGGDRMGELFQAGPAFLWISDNNANRRSIVACGSSDMSGATP